MRWVDVALVALWLAVLYAACRYWLHTYRTDDDSDMAAHIRRNYPEDET